MFIQLNQTNMTETLGTTPNSQAFEQQKVYFEQPDPTEWNVVDTTATEREATSSEAYNDVPLAEVSAIGGVAITGGESSQEASWPDFSFEEAVNGTRDLRTETVDGISFRTNLPEGVWPFEPTQPGKDPTHPIHRPLLPSAIDSLPAGEFHIANPDIESAAFDRRIIITEEPDGKRINRIGSRSLVKNAGNSEALMTALGNQFEKRVLDQGLGTEVLKYGELKAMPTPETTRKKAAELGVDIQYFPDQGLINGKDYLDSFAHEKFPISTASAEYYTHDTRDDHLTAMVIGAEPLKIALRDSAQRALALGMDADKWAGDVDDFTAYLRGTVSPTYNSQIMGYGPETLLSVGERIGIGTEKVEGILETARANAQKFGMELNQYVPKPVSLAEVA